MPPYIYQSPNYGINDSINAQQNRKSYAAKLLASLNEVDYTNFALEKGHKGIQNEP